MSRTSIINFFILMFASLSLGACTKSKYGSINSNAGSVDQGSNRNNQNGSRVLNFSVEGIENDRIKLSGNNFDKIQSAKIVDSFSNQEIPLQVRLSNGAEAFLEIVGDSISIALGTVYSLIITDVYGQSTVSDLSFSLQDGSIVPSMLSSNGAQNGDVFFFGNNGWTLGSAPVLSLPGASGLEIITSSSGNAPVTLTADEVILTNNSGYGVRHTNIQLSPTLANDLRGSSPSGSTWYYLFLISNGQSAQALFSTSADAPEMPAGFDYKLLVSALRTDGNFNFANGMQIGKVMRLDQVVSVLAGGQATAFTRVSLSNSVPPISKRIEVKLNCGYKTTSQSHGYCHLANRSNGHSIYNGMGGYWGNGAIYERHDANVAVNLRVTQSLYYKIATTTGYAAPQTHISVSSYEIPGNLN